MAEVPGSYFGALTLRPGQRSLPDDAAASADPYSRLCQTPGLYSPQSLINAPGRPDDFPGDQHGPYLERPDTSDPVIRAKLNSNLQPIYDPSKLPSLKSEAIASLPEDPQVKMKYLATALFPGMTPEEARTRMGMTKEGDIYYIDDSGSAYYAEPQFHPIDSPWQTLRSLPDEVFSAFGPGLPVAGAFAGGLLTAPEGGIAGEALGAGGGEHARQVLSNWLAGDDKTTDQMLEKDAQVALEQFYGSGATRLLGPLGKRAGLFSVPIVDSIAPRLAPYVQPGFKKATDLVGNAAGAWATDQALDQAQSPGSPVKWGDLPKDLGNDLLSDIPSWLYDLWHHPRAPR